MQATVFCGVGVRHCGGDTFEPPRIFLWLPHTSADLSALANGRRPDVVPVTLPGTVIGIGLTSLWNRSLTSAIYGSPAIIILGYVAQYAVLPIRVTAVEFGANSPLTGVGRTAWGCKLVDDTARNPNPIGEAGPDHRMADQLCVLLA